MLGLQLAKSTAVLNRSELLVPCHYKVYRKVHREWRCEPAPLAWQWSVKDSPDVQRCSPNTLKSKQCPRRSFFPRFRKVVVQKDLTSCEEEEKKMTWKEYFSFLLPEEITTKPPLAMCRKVHEMRKRRCEEDWKKCGGCVPTEWYGQGVVHNVKLTLPESNDLPMVRYCPPPDHMKPRCAVAKLSESPENNSESSSENSSEKNSEKNNEKNNEKNSEKSSGKSTFPVMDRYDYKVPFSSFKGGPSPPSAKQYIVKCSLKCFSIPSVHDKSAKLQCKTYGEFKGVECPKNMFTRFMSVDLPGGTLRPVSVSDHKPPREIKKGLCLRSSLTEPRGVRNYHTTAALHDQKALSLAPNPNETTHHQNHLQPSRSALCVDSMAKRAGVDLNQNRCNRIKATKKAPSRNILLHKLFNEDDQEKDNAEKLDEKVTEKVKIVPKTPLERLMMIQDGKAKKIMEKNPIVRKPNAKIPKSIEFFPYPIRKFHSGLKHKEKPLRKLYAITGTSANKKIPLRGIAAKYHWTPKYKMILRANLNNDDCDKKDEKQEKQEKQEVVQETKQEIKKEVEKEKCHVQKKKVSVHDIERETCFPSIPKKHKGVICSIARMFNIGCGKKC